MDATEGSGEGWALSLNDIKFGAMMVRENMQARLEAIEQEFNDGN